MSSGSSFVRFPDGTIRYGIYHGTSDVLRPNLFDTSAEAWAERDSSFQDPAGEIEPVEIYTNYGGGFWWRGTAARNATSR